MKPVLVSLAAFTALVSWAEPTTAQVLDALDAYWSEVSRTVEEGDFEGYRRLYHPDAVLVSTNAGRSFPIAQALDGWEQSFLDTRDGKSRARALFRFTERLHDETTAHETGILRYEAEDRDGSKSVSLVHFRALLVLKNGRWLMVMEHQQGEATQAEWQAAD